MKGNDYFHRHKKCWMNFFRQACKLVSSKEYPFLLSQLVKVSDLGSKHDMPFKVETHNLPLLSATILLIALLGRPFLFIIYRETFFDIII